MNLNDIDFLDQMTVFEKTWIIQNKTVILEANSYYERSPEWCTGVEVSIHVQDYFDIYNENFYLGGTQFEGKEGAELKELERNEERKLHDTINNIAQQIDNYCSKKELSFFCDELDRALQGYTLEQKEKIENDICEHNKKAEEFRKKHPFFAIEMMLKPGLNAIFEPNNGNINKYPVEWEEIYKGAKKDERTSN